jgi:hypothetical protein
MRQGRCIVQGERVDSVRITQAGVGDHEYIF